MKDTVRVFFLTKIGFYFESDYDFPELYIINQLRNQYLIENCSDRVTQVSVCR